MATTTTTTSDGVPPPPPPSSEPGAASQIAESFARSAARGIEKVGHELGHRRGLRVGLIGIAFLVVAAFLGTDSALTVPVAVVGLLLVAAGLLGRRLAGRFAVEWGPSGTVLEMRAALAPVGMTAGEQARNLPTAAPALPASNAGGGAATSSEADGEVIDATGETIELDVAELQAMLADHEERLKAEVLSAVNPSAKT